MIDLNFHGKIKLPENKIQDFINEFNILLQNNFAQFYGQFQQGYQYEDAEIIEEIKENV